MIDTVRYSPSSHVMACEVADETVLLDTEAGLYFGLDQVGTRIWSLASTGHSFQNICNRLEAEFDVKRDRLERDVATLLADLSGRRLITVVAPIE